MNDIEMKTKHKLIMGEIQKEWFKDEEYHNEFKDKIKGMRSSQISALVMYLIKKEKIE